MTKAWLKLIPVDLSDEVRKTLNLTKGTEEEQKKLSEDESSVTAFETIQDFKEMTKMTEDDFKEFINAISILDNTPDEMWLEKEVLEEEVDLQSYKNAKGLVQQIEGLPEKERTEQQKKNLTNAKAKVTAYEKKNPSKPKGESKDDEEEKEDEGNANLGSLFANENVEPKKGGTRGHKRGKLTHSTRKLKK